MVGVTLLRDNASKIFVVVSKHLPNNPALFTTCLITIVFLGLILGKDILFLITLA